MTSPFVIAVAGTRPEAIKLAPVLLAATRSGAATRVTLAATEQHRDGVPTALATFGLRADHIVRCPRRSGSLPELLATLSRGVEQLLVDTKPDAILVQGDTSTTFATALTAFYLGIPVVHLEAGLRTATIAQPFPEEAHRRLVAPITSLHLAPTEHA